MSEQKTIESITKEERRFPPPEYFKANAYVRSEDEYRRIYEESIRDPPKWWESKADELEWFSKDWGKSLSGTWMRCGSPGSREESSTLPTIA